MELEGNTVQWPIMTTMISRLREMKAKAKKSESSKNATPAVPIQPKPVAEKPVAQKPNTGTVLVK